MKKNIIIWWLMASFILQLKVSVPVLCSYTEEETHNSKQVQKTFAHEAQAQMSDTTSSSKSYSTGEVVITGTRNETDIRHLPMTISTVSHQQIESSFQSSLLPVLLEQVPGLFSTSRGIMGYGVASGASGGISLRGIGGSPTTGLLVLIDGHPQYMGLMGHPISDAYQSMLTEQVEVLRGAASVLYGSNAMGGVINIVTKKKRDDGVSTGVRLGYGSENTLQTDATSQIKKGKLNSVISVSYNRTDGHRENIEFEQYGGYAKVGYEFNAEWSMFGDLNLTHFNASNPGATSAPLIDNDSRITRGMTSFSLENNYEQTSGALKFYYNWGKHSINEGYKVDTEPLDYRFNSNDLMLGVSLYQSAELFKGNRLTVGVDYMSFGGDAYNHFLTDGHDVALVDRTENEAAGYVDFRQTLNKYLAMDAAVRLDWHSITGIEWIPQAGLSAQLPHDMTLKAMASKGFRNPTIRELYLFAPANSELLPERLWSYEVSFAQQLLDNKISYGLNLFYINGDNMIQTLPVNGRPLNVNTGKVENWGVEAELSYRIDSMWSMASNYSWLHMEEPVVAAPAHKLYLGATFSKSKLSLTTSLQYIIGLYTSVSPEMVTQDFILWSVIGSYQLSSFVELYVRGENLLGQDYEINLGYPMPKATVFGGVNLRF